MEHELGGDPMSHLKWTRKTTGKIAQQLTRLNIRVSPKTVGRLLKDMGFSLRVNHKRLESGNAHPPPRKVRNRQFRYLNRMRRDFARRHGPILSVDTKRRRWSDDSKTTELAGKSKPRPSTTMTFAAMPWVWPSLMAFSTPWPTGALWWSAPRLDTPAFAVDALACWWKERGSKDYPKAKELLILADCGGANSARSRVWKYLLATRLCEPHQMSVTVCHYPPGASKWNPIEHRLFSYLTKHWAGKPLETYETVLNYIRRTQTALACGFRPG